MNQKCKYRFYLTLIDNNRNVYKKTDYLLADCLELKISEDYSYPIFIEMIKQNLNSYYMTQNDNIYNNFCFNNSISQCFYSFKIIKWKVINGDFLEKFFDLVLKLKVVVSAFAYFSFENIFYNIEYITYIFLGHGTSYFKDFIFNDYQSCNKYNKILIPPCPECISIAKKYGWKDGNIIKLGIPKWDKYNEYENDRNIKNKSIFLMFTWRRLKKGKKISEFYINNTFNLLTNKRLNKELEKKNITLFYTFHFMLKNLINFKNYPNLNNFKNIKKVEQPAIFELIKNSSLLISDFSSIIFDFIYRKKPVLLFVPDSDDPQLINIYNKEYYDIIQRFKNGTIFFLNKFKSLKQIIKKIIYYINNNFTIENKIHKFYERFNLNSINNTKKFIEYLKNIK